MIPTFLASTRIPLEPRICSGARTASSFAAMVLYLAIVHMRAQVAMAFTSIPARQPSSHFDPDALLILLLQCFGWCVMPQRNQP